MYLSGQALQSQWNLMLMGELYSKHSAMLLCPAPKPSPPEQRWTFAFCMEARDQSHFPCPTSEKKYSSLIRICREDPLSVPRTLRFLFIVCFFFFFFPSQSLLLRSVRPALLCSNTMFSIYNLHYFYLEPLRTVRKLQPIHKLD